MTTYKYLGDRNSDGTILGYDTNEKIGFYGYTPVVQRSGSTQAAVAVSTITTAAITTTTNSYGFASTTQLNDLTATVAAQTVLLNEIRAALVLYGLIKGAA